MAQISSTLRFGSLDNITKLKISRALSPGQSYCTSCSKGTKTMVWFLAMTLLLITLSASSGSFFRELLGNKLKTIWVFGNQLPLKRTNTLRDLLSQRWYLNQVLPNPGYFYRRLITMDHFCLISWIFLQHPKKDETLQIKVHDVIFVCFFFFFVSSYSHLNWAVHFHILSSLVWALNVLDVQKHADWKCSKPFGFGPALRIAWSFLGLYQLVRPTLVRITQALCSVFSASQELPSWHKSLV